MIRSAVLLAFLLPVVADAADPSHVCPAEISAVWSIPSPPEGWNTLEIDPVARHRLRGATFTDGHPKGQAFLKPYDAATNAPGTKGLRRDVYHFTAAYPDGIWLVCRYQDTPAIVFKRLSETPKSCDVSYSMNAANASGLAIRCQ